MHEKARGINESCTKNDQEIKRGAYVGINYMLCHANAWNKDENESKVIATFTINNDILIAKGDFDNFYSKDDIALSKKLILRPTCIFGGLPL